MDWWKYNYLPLFNTGGEPGGGGGGGEPPAGDPPAGDPPAGNPPAGDPPAGDPPAGDPPELYRPEGLPDHLLGASDHETIDNLKKAVDGYRERDGEVPEESAGYASFQENTIPETLRPHIQELSNDPLFAKVTEKAKELRMPLGAFQSLTTELYTAAQDMGLLEAPIDVEAERAALTPEHAKGLPEAEQKIARDKRMNDNFGWLDLLSGDEKSGVSKEMAEHLKTELGDSALGHQFFEAMRSKISGTGGPGGGGSGSGNQDAYAALQARAAEPKNNPSSREFDQKSYEQLKADLQKYHEANPT